MSPELELDPEVELPEPFDELDELDDSADFAPSDGAAELSDEEPLELAAPSLPADTVLEPFRLSVR